MSYDDYIAKVASSGNMLAINVKVADLKHNILRGMIGGYEALVKKHEDTLAAIKEYLVDEKR